MSRPSVIIRELQDNDLNAVVELTRLRFSEPYSPEAIRHSVYGAEGVTVRNWLAIVDDKPAGLTGWVVQEFQYHSKHYKVGYWQHLFVHPDYRKLMLYPQLVFAMQKGAQEFGLDFICNANRRLEVWQAHLKLGFKNIGDIAVLIKPLRPTRLVRKSKQLPKSFDLLGQPIDWLYSLYQATQWLRVDRRRTVEQLTWNRAVLEELCTLLTQDATTRLHQVFTPELLQARYQTNLEEDPYILFGIRDRGRLVAALTYRAGLRGNQIYTGVIMDLVFAPGSEMHALSLMAAAESHALNSGCEVMLYLDGIGATASRLVKRYGYFRSPEQYVMLVWSKSQPELPLLEDWRFSFANHDAF